MEKSKVKKEINKNLKEIIKKRYLEKEKVKQDNLPAPSFRLSARSFFLTYPKCDLDIDVFVEKIFEKVLKYEILEYIISKETHEDNTPHYHAYIKCEKKLDIKKSDYFDLTEGEESKTFHGKYEPAKKRDQVINYISKDVFTSEQANLVLRMSDNVKDELSKIYCLVDLDERMNELAKKGEVEEALVLLEREDKKRYIREGKKIEETLRWIHMRSSGWKSKYNFEDFIIPQGLLKCFEAFEECALKGEPRCLVLIGESGCGKTQLVIAYFEQKLKERCHRISCFDGIRFIRDKTVLLMDDFNWKYLDREDILSLIDQSSETVVNIKHSSQKIPASIKRCIVSNFILKDENVFFAHPSVARRLIIYHVPKDVFLFGDSKEKSIGDKIVEKYMLEAGDAGNRPVFHNEKELKSVMLKNGEKQYISDRNISQYLGSQNVPRTYTELKLKEKEVLQLEEKSKEYFDEISKMKKSISKAKQKVRGELYSQVLDIEYEN